MCAAQKDYPVGWRLAPGDASILMMDQQEAGMLKEISEEMTLATSVENGRTSKIGSPDAPVGWVEEHVQPRVGEPRLRYRGFGDPHWRGQPCYLIGQSPAQAEERSVIMACGCRASVPWWTLELLSDAA
jgi:hypothetical protein